MKIADNLELNPIDYANQGNSLIGIRGSGKTYTATKIAEEVMSAGIPIIAFDPTGVWQNLRFGVDGHNGFPIVVIGGFNGDIPLNEETITNIVEAALKENISLIIDLQETGNKSKWMRVIHSCIEFLMANNQKYGLRHIFIEEAAEFVPQRPNPGGMLVYSSIERMARIGRNFGLGYTLINQRPEEIAKAVFEISELVVVHRQSGKNSLNSIKDWLNVRGQADKGIVQSLPSLESGECWAIDNNQEVRIKVLPKNTFHPDPKKGKTTAPTKISSDASSFIENIFVHLGQIDKGTKAVQPKGNDKLLAENNWLKTRLEEELHNITALERERDELRAFVKSVKSLCLRYDVYSVSHEIAEANAPDIKKAAPNVKQQTTPSVSKASKPKSGSMRMLKAVAMFHPKSITKQRMATLAGLSMKSGSFSNNISSLKISGFITVEGSNYTATKQGLIEAGDIESIPTDPKKVVQMWCENIGPNSGAARMLVVLSGIYPKSISRAELGDKTSLSYKSGSFSNNISILKRNGLVTVSATLLRAADELFKSK